MTELTRAQQVYRARLAIRDLVGGYETNDGDAIDSIDISFDGGVTGIPDVVLEDLGVDPEIVEGYRLAVDDLVKARVVMEEQAAFDYLTKDLQGRYPLAPRAQIQKAARALVADPDTRESAAEASGVYAVFEELVEPGSPR